MDNTKSTGNIALAATQYGKERDYWLDKLSGELVKSSFPYDYKKVVINQRKMNSAHFEITGELFEKIIKLSNERDNRLHMILLACVVLLLDKYSYKGEKDIIVGVPIYKQEVEGDFINTVLALRNQFTDDIVFKDLLLSVRKTLTDATDHQNYPIKTLLYQLKLMISEGEFPLFDVAVLLENIHDKNYLHDIPNSITFSFLRKEKSLSLLLEFDSNRYSMISIERIFNHLKTLIQQAVFNINEKVGNLSILTEQERVRILETFNNTKRPYPADKTIDALFEEQVKANPDKIAVVYEDQAFSYGLINQKAQLLAGVLQHMNVSENESIGIMAGRTPEMVIGVIAVLKAGAAYMPVDVDYPDARKAFILKNGNVRILLTRSNETISFVEHVVRLDEPALYGKEQPVASQHRANSLAYIMYTSGSSGTPKGVMVEHRNVVRLVKNNRFIELVPEDRILQTGALEFDASTFEIWGALLNGLQLHLVDKERILTEDSLKKVLLEHDISTIWMTSPLFNQMLDLDVEIFANLDNLLVGGDVLSPVHINQVRKKYPHLKVINGYGPTENTTFSTTFLVDREYDEGFPIGSPISNSTAYIFDQYDRLLPVGVPGELIVGGDGVARGYLNNLALTKEKFITNPYNPNEKLYKTGDLARWQEDGNIEFLGRIDQQVKIRGFRIEPGEIENQLLKFDFIKEAVVTDRTNEKEGKYLCAYLVANQKIDMQELKHALSKKVPDYMVPSYFVQLDHIPLTSNEKVDRNALPEPEFCAESSYVAPRDDVERTLVNIWSEVLAVDKDVLSIDKDFFDLGGHSLKATRFISKFQKEMGIKIPLAEIFRTPTIRELAAHVRKKGQRIFIPIEKIEIQDFYPISSTQMRMYTVQQLKHDLTNYNVSIVLELSGNLDFSRVEKTFQQLIVRHESFRTSFCLINGEVYQKISPEVPFAIEECAIIEEGKTPTIEEIITGFIRAFDLGQAPLIRVGLSRFKNNPHKFIMIVDTHHIITDGTSMGIFIKEFMELYEGKVLPELTIQYKDFVVWQNKMKEAGEMKRQEDYWKNKFADVLPMLSLPTDFPRPTMQSFEGDWFRFSLDDDETAALNTIAKDNDATLFIVMLALFDILLVRLSGQEDIVVGTPIAGRSHADLYQIMGMFVNMLALRNHPTADKTFIDFLNEVKESTLDAFENQDYQYGDLVESLAIARDISTNPLFNVVLVLQNMDIPYMAIPGLTLKSYDREYKQSKFDMTLSGIELDGKLELTFEYCVKLFKKETIERFAGYFKEIVATVIKNVNTPLGEIKLSQKLLTSSSSVSADEFTGFGF